jgi:predicted nucleic acid-binding protein
MSVLVDTNVLLRRTQPKHELYTVAVESVAQILGTGEPVYFTLQNISEFWNVVTRPLANNGLGFAPAMALAEVEKIERILTRLPDTPAVYAGPQAAPTARDQIKVGGRRRSLAAPPCIHGAKSTRRHHNASAARQSGDPRCS